MEILYISSVPSSGEFHRIQSVIRKGINTTTYGMSESGFKFHSLILDGMRRHDGVRILSLVGRSVNIKTHKGLLWRTKKENVLPNVDYKHLGFINIPVIKQLWLCFSFYFNTINWIYKHRSTVDKFIIMDASYVTILPFVVFATKTIHCKKSAVFCDIYEYMGSVKDARGTKKVSILHRIVRTLIKNTYRSLDSYILLTEQMNEVVNPLSKPYIILEGLVDIQMAESNNRIDNKAEHDVAMYAGALREQYGVNNLIDGFMNYHNDNARLWIFGAGDYESRIDKASKIDERIMFFGHVDLKKVISKELEATLLINPRPVNSEFTQYSFPSKIMEYMASGTPVLTTKLPGIPQEYYNYVYTIDGNDATSITESFEHFFLKTKLELHNKGQLAKGFVLQKKNNVIQSQRILDLLKLISS